MHLHEWEKVGPREWACPKCGARTLVRVRKTEVHREGAVRMIPEPPESCDEQTVIDVLEC